MAPLRILVTGSEGLVGSHLTRALRQVGHEVVGLDVRAREAPQRADVRDESCWAPRLHAVDGIIHLAAVSRVVTAQQQPDLCWQTNVDPLRRLLHLALRRRPRPWVIFASSREVYGRAPRLPATEDSPRSPCNIYGRSKLAGEHLCEEAAAEGLIVVVVRLSNVFGAADDHADRVVPAFVRAGLAGLPLRVDGSDNTFDFTHVSDAVAGIAALVDLVDRERRSPPPVHLVTGVPTTLGALASCVAHVTGSRAGVREAPSRDYDVAHFVGDPARAHALLGWRARTDLATGLHQLTAALRRLEAPSRSLPDPMGTP